MSDLISRQAAIDAFTAYSEYESNRTNADWVTRIHTVLRSLPPAQPEKRTEERTETHARDYISRQAAMDAMETWDWQELYLPIHFKQLLEELPPAQSEYTEQDMREQFNAGYACGMRAAQSERKRGKWEQVEVNYIADMDDEIKESMAIASMFCPCCKRYHNEVYMYGNPTSGVRYCSNCGADMREDDNDD